MALISNAALQVVLDKLARFSAMSVGDTTFDASFSAGMQAASAAVISGSGSLAAYIMSTNDEDVEADLLGAARDLDEANPTPPARFIIGIPGIAALITDINRHIKRFAGGPTSLDQYLSSLNASVPTLRAHQAFSDHLVKLSPKNVFIGADLDIARLDVTGATAGTFTHLAAINHALYGGAKLVAKNVGALTATTAISLTARKFDLTTATLTATISTLTSGAETNLSSVVREFIDVTAITVVSGGTAGNVIKIVAKTDRDISAA